GAGRAGAEGWSAGVASVEITPEGPVWMAGYASRKTPSEGVTHPLKAKALALRDAEGRAVVWVTADLIGFDRDLTETVAARVKERHGLPRESLALFASHTHTGPVVKRIEQSLAASGIDPARGAPNVAYRQRLESKLVDLVGSALGDLKPSELSYGKGKAGFAINRRENTPTGFKIGLNPSGPTDTDVPMLRVTDANGQVRAVVFGYACHNTTMTDKIMTISGDYAGFAQSEIEAKHPGAVALFLTGCGADANPNPRGTIELARAHGHELAEAVEAVLARPDELARVSGTLRAAFAEPNLRFAGPTDRASYEARLMEPGEGRRKHAARMIAAIDAGKPIESTIPYATQAFALGDGLTVLALAGEVVVDYAIRFKSELAGPGRTLWVSAYANDVFGYVPSVRVLREGGYEGGESFYYSTFPTPFAEDVEETIVTTVKDVVARARGSK
ncbi:MAG: neutral/alkaline non-lysosomal ceramidase N-terminal domain-containing protein, partial [Isosphaeraceae bacterium]